MSRYSKIMKNDIVDGIGICVSLWMQGCHKKCFNCHNPQTWDFNGGYELPSDIRGELIKDISENGIKRNFSILGGEPLCPENLKDIDNIVTGVRMAYPHIKIFIWTGYTLEELYQQNNFHIINILNQIDVLIDGPYIDAQRDITLYLRGSKNQRVLYKGKDF